MPTLDDLDIDLKSITNPTLRQAIRRLSNLVEDAALANTRLKAENQALRDEIARLKGEQGKPNIRGNNRGDTSDDSSESQRKAPPKRPGAKGSKNQQLTVTQTRVVTLDRTTLPEDAVPKGYTTSIIQDLVITTEVVELKRETYYSPSQRREFTAPVPAGYDGAFGPQLKSLALLLKTPGNMTEPAITRLFQSFGVAIEQSSVDRMLLKRKQPFHDEKTAIFEAGLRSTPYQHIDDTSARVRGANHHCHIICNPLYSAFFTRERKDRLSVLNILSGVETSGELPHVWNPEAEGILMGLGWANKHDHLLTVLPRTSLTKPELTSWCADRELGRTATERLLEATAIAAYHVRTDIPVVSIFMADDAPQFKLLTRVLALCWIHDGRHYKKLRPVIPEHRHRLDEFLTDYWEFYHQLLVYKDYPSQEGRDWLEHRFETLFSTTTGYDHLDARIAKTRAKQPELLLVLNHPELPLHNNPAELGARAQVRKRDVSLHTMTDEGTKVQDTFLTIAETAKKLGVNLADYLFDRVSGTYAMPSLADIIRERSGQVSAGV